MSESRPNGGESPPEFDEGRYVYCVVRVDGDESADAAASADANTDADAATNVDTNTDTDDALADVTGVDGEPVSLVVADGVGAVVHACDGIYDSADLAEIRRWLVRHQSVVDAAGERFGTPVPFQFDTIVRGDDAAVREWLREERATLADVLASLAGHWEYRVEVVRTDPADEAALEAVDDRLASLRERIDAADGGAAFLVEKQYDRRVAEVRRDRREALAADLRERLAEHAREVHELERSRAATLGDEDDDTGAETVCRLTILASEAAEDGIGSALDDAAAEPGIEVRFTGPWPPYTFVPELGDDEPADAGETVDGGG